MSLVRTRHPRSRGGAAAVAPVRRILREATSPRRQKIIVPPGAEIGLDPGLIAGIAEKIARRFNPDRIVLFGSRARGDARPDSDIDLFVEMESKFDQYERSAQVDQLFARRNWSLDVIVYTPQEVKKAIRQAGFLIDAIDEEGKVLYVRQ